MDEKEKVDKLFNWFDSKRSEIIAGHHGEQVLIHDYKVIGYYQDFSDACDMADNFGFEDGNYIIQDCLTQKEEAEKYFVMGGLRFA